MTECVTIAAVVPPEVQAVPHKPAAGHSSISIFSVLPFLPSSIKIVLGDSCDWPDPVPWQRAMLRSDFDRRPARLYQKPRPMECEELIIRNCAQAISARAGNNVPVEARGPADGRAMGRGWLRSIRALRLLLTQTLSHVTLLNPPYYFNVKRSLSKPVDLWDRHWYPLVGVNTRRRNPRCASDAPDGPSAS